mmetsp:Transcript_28262/g.66411  ORF Transcript_28262/g.66411 Transcript_28262/m.66411 type:complete len:219 (+) Transcript_28262:1479-2135(+)
MAFKAGTMCLPCVVVDMREGLKASPLKRMTASCSPRASDSALSSFIRVTKRAMPPTGSLERGSTLYTSLKCKMVILFDFSPPAVSATQRPLLEAATSFCLAERVQQCRISPLSRRYRSAESRKVAVSQASVQAKSGPETRRVPIHQPSTSGFSIHCSKMCCGTPLDSSKRPSGSSSRRHPVHNMRSLSASSAPAEKCTALSVVVGCWLSPHSCQWWKS